MSAKYVCSRDAEGNEEIFIFSSKIDHDAYAETLHRMRNRTRGEWSRIRRDIVSAGLVGPDLQCHGRSETLGLSSREQDSAILARQMGA